MRQVIEALLKSNVSGAEIERRTGISRSKITRLRKEEIDLSYIYFATAEKLYDYAIKEGIE